MKSYYIVFILLCSRLVQAIPQIINFSSKDYKSHSINYDFVQDKQGLIYVANAYGVLIFDGVNWRKVGLNDGKSAISLTQSEEGKIFVGSSSEFGFLQKDEQKQILSSQMIVVLYAQLNQNKDLFFPPHHLIELHQTKRNQC